MVQINLGKIKKRNPRGKKRVKTGNQEMSVALKRRKETETEKDSIKQEGGGEDRAALCNMLKGGSCLAGATFGIWITKQDSLPSPLGP